MDWFFLVLRVRPIAVFGIGKTYSPRSNCLVTPFLVCFNRDVAHALESSGNFVL